VEPNSPALAHATSSPGRHGREDLGTRNNAVRLYEAQGFAEQRRLLEAVLSNGTFDRGTRCPTDAKPFAFGRGVAKTDSNG
jgi:hypothetical protein